MEVVLLSWRRSWTLHLDVSWSDRFKQIRFRHVVRWSVRSLDQNWCDPPFHSQIAVQSLAGRVLSWWGKDWFWLMLPYVRHLPLQLRLKTVCEVSIKSFGSRTFRRSSTTLWREYHYALFSSRLLASQSEAFTFPDFEHSACDFLSEVTSTWGYFLSLTLARTAWKYSFGSCRSRRLSVSTGSRSWKCVGFLFGAGDAHWPIKYSKLQLYKL
jgi:hypothetical protein